MAPPVYEVASTTSPSTTIDVISDAVTHNTTIISNLTVNLYSKICWSLIGVLGILGNLIVIVVMLSHSVTRKRLTNLLVINQCFVDLVASLCLLLMALLDAQAVMTFTKDKVIDEVLCRVWFSGAIVWGSLMASGYGIVFLSFERYLAIVHPFRYATKFTRSKAVIGIVAIWVVCYAYNLAYFVPTTIIVDGVCLSVWYWPSVASRRCVFVLTFVLQYTVPICCLAVTYSLMYRVLHRRTLVGNGGNVGTKRYRCNGIRRRLCEYLAAMKRVFKRHSRKDVCLCRESEFREFPSPVPQIVSFVSLTETELPETMVDLRSRPSADTDLDHTYSCRQLCVGVGPRTPSDTNSVHSSSTEAKTASTKTATFPTTYDKAKRNLFKTMVAVSVSFVLCWTPNQLLFVLSSFGVHILYGYLYDVTVMLILLQCFVNPFIYAVKYRDFQTSIRLLIRRSKKKTSTESTSFTLQTQ